MASRLRSENMEAVETRPYDDLARVEAELSDRVVPHAEKSQPIGGNDVGSAAFV